MSSPLAKNYVKELIRLTKKLNEKETQTTIERFVILLQERRRLRLAPQILKELEAEAQREQGNLPVNVHVVSEISPKIQKDLQKAVERLSGKPPTFTIEKDPDLLGGFTLSYEDTVVDASLRGRLQRLRQYLIS